METFYFILLFIAVFCLYAYSSLRLRKDKVIAVEAGTIDGVCSEVLKQSSYYVKHKIIKDNKGNILDPDNIIRIVIRGNCMKPLNINTGDEMIAVKIDKNKSLSEQISKNDVLLIYLEDKRIHKIRAFEDFNTENELKTFWFEDNGQKHYSSRPHSSNSVLGVVRYRV